MRTSNRIGLAPNFKVEGEFDVARFLKQALNSQLKTEGCGVVVASVKVTPSDRHEVIVHRV